MGKTVGVVRKDDCSIPANEEKVWVADILGGIILLMKFVRSREGEEQEQLLAVRSVLSRW